MCKKAVSKERFMLQHFLDKCKSKEMCKEAVDAFLPLLKFRELMPVAWHAKRWENWCMAEDILGSKNSTSKIDKICWNLHYFTTFDNT